MSRGSILSAASGCCGCSRGLFGEARAQALFFVMIAVSGFCSE
jgi:hypothetical protein